MPPKRRCWRRKELSDKAKLPAMGYVGVARNFLRSHDVVSTTKLFTNPAGAAVAANTNIMTAGPRGPPPLQDVWLIEIASGLGLCPQRDA